MGMRFSEATIKSGFKVTQPDWYLLKISAHRDKPTAAKDSKNHFVTFDVIQTQEGEEPEKMLGVPVVMMYNDKPESAWTSLELFTVANGGELDPEKDYPFEELVGITLEGYIRRGTRQDGSSQNTISEFAPAGTNLPGE